MGVDLRLLVVDGECDVLWFSHTLLSLERRRGLWDAINAAKFSKRLVTYPFSSYVAPRGTDDTGYGKHTKDSYGDVLRWVTAGDLATLVNHDGVQDNHINRAAWAFIGALDPKTKIVFDWH